MASDGGGALVVVATYNESENLPSLLAAVHVAAPRAHVLVVDDASPDGTGEMARRISRRDRRVHVLRRAGKLGYGTAVLAGFRWALARRYRAICTMDADFSHEPRHLPQLLGAMEAADLAIGSRYVGGISVVHWPLWRLVLSLGGNRYARWLTGIPARDLTSGFRVFRRELVERIPLDRIHSNGYAFILEMNFWAHRLGARIVEVPIIFVDRRVGVSKMDGNIILEAVLTPYRLWWDWLVHGRRARGPGPTGPT